MQNMSYQIIVIAYGSLSALFILATWSFGLHVWHKEI